MTSATVHLAAGLPLTWVSQQKDQFRAYLLQNSSVDFRFRGIDYHVDFARADVFPQGFSAVADRLGEFEGVNMLCDIGNGTMNVMYINDFRPQEKKCFTEKYGVNQCVLAIRENLMKLYGVCVDEVVIERVLRCNKADISSRYLKDAKNNGNLPSGSQSHQPRYRPVCLRRSRLHELFCHSERV